MLQAPKKYQLRQFGFIGKQLKWIKKQRMRNKVETHQSEIDENKPIKSGDVYRVWKDRANVKLWIGSGFCVNF